MSVDGAFLGWRSCIGEPLADSGVGDSSQGAGRGLLVAKSDLTHAISVPSLIPILPYLHLIPSQSVRSFYPM